MQITGYAGQPLSCDIAALKLFISEDQRRLSYRRRLSSGCTGQEPGFERFDRRKTRSQDFLVRDSVPSPARPDALARVPLDTALMTVPGEGC